MTQKKKVKEEANINVMLLRMELYLDLLNNV